MSSNQQFSSNKPYLFRAIYDWLLDNDATPYILVDASRPDVDVPDEHIKDGQIVLNINPSAVQNWQVDNEAISFNARFAGVARQIYVPMHSLLAVYAQENGLGMAFPAQDEEDQLIQEEQGSHLASVETDDELPPEPDGPAPKKGGHLKIVK